MTIEKIRALLYDYFSRTGKYAALVLYPCGSGCVMSNDRMSREPEIIQFRDVAELVVILRADPAPESGAKH